LIEFPSGSIGVAFDRLDLDAWVDDYKARMGRKSKKQLKGTSCQKSKQDSPKEGEYWHINKIIKGRRTLRKHWNKYLEEAERYLNRRIYELREELVHGEKRQRTFIEAATKYLNEETKKSLDRDAYHAKNCDALYRQFTA
jgi:hypothetical protein